MTIKELIKGLEVKKVVGKTDIDIKDVVCNSNLVSSQSLFICINGVNTDGHKFIKQAISYGAVCVVCEKEFEENVTQIIVKDSRLAMSLIASNFYGNPQKKLKLVGVTGTNGKTTTSQLIHKILCENGIKSGVIGTIGTTFGKFNLEPTLTTPDPISLYKTLKLMVEDGVKIVVMELSAHAIYLRKLHNLEFEIVVFTNLSQDHLDFFKDMESYKKAKIDLFLNNKIKYAVLNSDDKVGLEISKIVNKPILYGINNPADCFAVDINLQGKNTEFVLNLFDCICFAKTKLKGMFNVYNCLASCSVCCMLGVSAENTVKALEKIDCISGRLECVYYGDYSILIDYAHTPDGLEKCLTALKEITTGKLYCVFGCGGNRDTSKREIMGEISGRYADFTIITTDNPRYEDPMDIINQIEIGVKRVCNNYVIVQDRIQAIKYAINSAKKGDLILVAGKGSEQYQEVLGIKKQYNDKDTIQDIIRGTL